MLIYHQTQLPADEATVRAALAEYQAAIEAHRATEGVPAPWPAYEILREIVAAGGEFEVDQPAPIEPPPPPTEEEMRARALLEARAARTFFFARLDGLQVSALTTGDTALAIEIEGVKQAMRDITSIDLSSYTALADMRHAFKAQWDEIRAPLSIQLKSSFAELDQ